MQTCERLVAVNHQVVSRREIEGEEVIERLLFQCSVFLWIQKIITELLFLWCA